MEPPCRCGLMLGNFHLRMLHRRIKREKHVFTSYLEVCLCIHAHPWKWDRNHPSQARSVASWWWLQPPASMVNIVGLQSPAPRQQKSLATRSLIIPKKSEGVYHSCLGIPMDISEIFGFLLISMDISNIAVWTKVCIRWFGFVFCNSDFWNQIPNHQHASGLQWADGPLGDEFES